MKPISLVLGCALLAAVTVPQASGVTVINGTFDDNAASYTVWPG